MKRCCWETGRLPDGKFQFPSLQCSLKKNYRWPRLPQSKMLLLFLYFLELVCCFPHRCPLHSLAGLERSLEPTEPEGKPTLALVQQPTLHTWWGRRKQSAGRLHWNKSWVWLFVWEIGGVPLALGRVSRCAVVMRVVGRRSGMATGSQGCRLPLLSGSNLIWWHLFRKLQRNWPKSRLESNTCLFYKMISFTVNQSSSSTTTWKIHSRRQWKSRRHFNKGLKVQKLTLHHIAVI